MDEKLKDVMTPRQKHLRDIDIPAWQFKSGNWFTIRLFDLMAHADTNNFYLLSLVFPEEAEAFKWWQSGAWAESRREQS